jgi:hypothetical protein
MILELKVRNRGAHPWSGAFHLSSGLARDNAAHDRERGTRRRSFSLLTESGPSAKNQQCSAR